MGRIATHTGQEITWDQVMKSEFQFVKDIDHLTLDTPAPITRDRTASTRRSRAITRSADAIRPADTCPRHAHRTVRRHRPLGQRPST